jgi:hypothetical protein
MNGRWLRGGSHLAVGLAVAVIGSAVSPGVARAHGPDDCTDLAPARLGSPSVLHVLDPHGDTDEALGVGGRQIYPGQSDIIGAWVSGPSAWDDRGSSEPFRANIQVEALPSHPINMLYLFHYAGPQGEERFLMARAEWQDSWWFGYGHSDHTLPTTRSIIDGTTVGSVDAPSGVVSMIFPAGQLPARGADGSALAWNVVKIETRLHTAAPRYVGELPAQGLNWLIDDAPGDACRVLLYEPKPLHHRLQVTFTGNLEPVQGCHPAADGTECGNQYKGFRFPSGSDPFAPPFAGCYATADHAMCERELAQASRQRMIPARWQQGGVVHEYSDPEVVTWIGCDAVTSENHCEIDMSTDREVEMHWNQ